MVWALLIVGDYTGAAKMMQLTIWRDENYARRNARSATTPDGPDV